MPAALGPPSLHAPFLLLPPPQAEAEQRAKAKEDLKAFLLSNEVNKKIKEEQAERERQEDVRYMQQQAAQLDRQERERQQLLERVRAVQVGPKLPVTWH
jgi:tripartite-type tricarboxylate transporter receptor subunit TctC